MENYTFTITVKDIYGTENPEIPKGYKVVGFRIPTKGSNEMFLTDDSAAVYSVRDFFPGKREPRLILEKLPEKRFLEMSKCAMCPHFDLYDAQLTGLTSIPDWCPLPISIDLYVAKLVSRLLKES